MSFIGCTVSVVLFSAANGFNEKESGEDGQRSLDEGRRETTHPPVSAFMEGMTISIKTIMWVKCTLKEIDDIVDLV